MEWLLVLGGVLLIGLAVIMLITEINATGRKDEEQVSFDGWQFQFRYQREPQGHYRIDCLTRPRNSRSTCPNKCHIYATGEVCVDDRHRPRTLAKARAIARFFARGYVTYLETGTFPNGRQKVRV